MDFTRISPSRALSPTSSLIHLPTSFPYKCNPNLNSSTSKPFANIKEDGGASGDGATSFEGGQNQSFNAQEGSVTSPCSPSPEQSILHGTILEHSPNAGELEERAMQIAELKLKLIQALLSRRKLDLVASANNSSTSLACNTSGVSAVESDLLANSALVTSMIAEIEDCYDKSLIMMDENQNKNLVRVYEEEDQHHGHEHNNEGVRQHLARWVENSVNREDVLDRIGSASIVGSQLLAGDLAGWTAAYIIQKFGKVAITAIGGGLILLKIAHQKGYILVNWSNIYDQLEQVTVTGDKKEGLDDWITDKAKSIKTWAQNNSCIVVGFICGFFYKTFG